MVNKYVFNNQEFLIYNDNVQSPIAFKDIQIVCIEKNIDLLNKPEYHKLPILKFDDFIKLVYGHRTGPVRDRVLESERIRSFYDLQCAYNLLRNQQLQKSARVRKFVEEKYSEIMDLVPVPDEVLAGFESNAENLES